MASTPIPAGTKVQHSHTRRKGVVHAVAPLATDTVLVRYGKDTRPTVSLREHLVIIK